VNELDRDECVYLLRNWLLSLTMNDLSFFLTLAATDDNSSATEDDNDNDQGPKERTEGPRADGGLPPKIVVVRRQTKDAPGIARVETVSHGNSRGGSSIPHACRARLKYQIKLIDCDPKPAKKLRDREAKEVPFSLLREK
jgi:Inositol-pentakisphosphate 2-kinase